MYVCMCLYFCIYYIHVLHMHTPFSVFSGVVLSDDVLAPYFPQHCILNGRHMWLSVAEVAVDGHELLQDLVLVIPHLRLGDSETELVPGGFGPQIPGVERQKTTPITGLNPIAQNSSFHVFYVSSHVKIIPTSTFCLMVSDH